MTKRRIVISEYDNIAALMEDDKAVEFIIHRGDMLLGDIYLAQVENILPSIDAAFVNVGGDKMGFLHSSDVPGKGDLKDRLEPKQTLVVQIMKEPTGHKGPRVSTNISLPGRFLVMMPESKGISISRKIEEQAERSRLKSIVSLVKPPGVGVIIRTEAENQKESDITEDFETLIERWQNIVSMADTAQPPTLLYRDQDLLYRVIRENVTEEVNEIVVDTAFGQQRAQQLLQNWNLDKNIKVSLYQGNQPILMGTGVDKEIKQALQTKVPLPSGGYLYIQPTEALTVIDVNSGKFTSLASQAETIKLTNLEACKEIARQLRLRNIGGMIIVDFIDMESRANQLQVLQTFENELAPDKAKPQIGQLSDLGLVEMTRHRQGQSLSEIFTRRCPTCLGTGHAMEEFTWMHNNMDPENRGAGRQGGRNKLPLRHGKPTMMRPKPQDKHQQAKRIALEAITGEKPDGKKDQGPVDTGSMLLNRLSGLKILLPENVDYGEYFTEQIQKQMGAKLSAVAKLAFMPTGINGVLARINPKANDIVTLVHSIENAASMPMPMHLDALDEDEDEAELDEREEREEREEAEAAEDEESEPEAVEERRPANKRGQGGRNGRRGGRPEPREMEVDVLAEEADEDTEEADEVPMEPVAVVADSDEYDVIEPEDADEPDEDKSLVPVGADSDEPDDDEPDDEGGDEEAGAEEESQATAGKGATNPRAGRNRRRGRPAKRSLKKVTTKP